MSVYRLTLQTLSPIHIGDGDELRQGFDFMTRGGQTYRLNEDALLRAKESRLRPNARGRYPLPGELLDEADYQTDAFFHYVLRGAPRSSKADARVRAMIKDMYYRPYIPGSSLKGALRTALAWSGWNEAHLTLDRAAIGRRRSWAGQPLERMLFGRDPNHDLLRALQVSDLHGPQTAGEGLILVNAQVLTKRAAGSPVELEALGSNIAFSGTLTIDEALFGGDSPYGQAAARELQFGRRRRWLDELAARVQRHSQARIARLAAWFEDTQGGERIAAFYRKLEAADPGPNGALVQLGWGTGWDGKSFWTHLQADPQLFARILVDYRMLKGRGSPPPGAPFPTSRRVAMVVKESIARPVAPFGWALLELHKENQ